MSSESKKRKQVSMYCDGSSLKWKNKRCKGVIFYNSAQRQQEKSDIKRETENGYTN